VTVEIQCLSSLPVRDYAKPRSATSLIRRRLSPLSSSFDPMRGPVALHERCRRSL